jgi:hypothetical protein
MKQESIYGRSFSRNCRYQVERSQEWLSLALKKKQPITKEDRARCDQRQSQIEREFELLAKTYFAKLDPILVKLEFNAYQRGELLE